MPRSRSPLANVLNVKKPYKINDPMKKKAPLVIACNEEISAANDAIAGSFTVIQGGQMVVPFGDYPVIIRINGQPMRVLQRVDAQAANAMTADLGGWLKKFLVGRPIYVGHPYHPDAAIAAKWPDKRSRGTIKDITVSNESVTLDITLDGKRYGQLFDFIVQGKESVP